MAKKQKCNRVYTYFNPDNGHTYFIVARKKKQARKVAMMECAPGRRVFKDEIKRVFDDTPGIYHEYWHTEKLKGMAITPEIVSTGDTLVGSSITD